MSESCGLTRSKKESARRPPDRPFIRITSLQSGTLIPSSSVMSGNAKLRRWNMDGRTLIAIAAYRNRTCKKRGNYQSGAYHSSTEKKCSGVWVRVGVGLGVGVASKGGAGDVLIRTDCTCNIKLPRWEISAETVQSTCNSHPHDEAPQLLFWP